MDYILVVKTSNPSRYATLKSGWIQRWNLVEIPVDFANRFWLDPTGEIRLNSTIEIWLNSTVEIWLKYVQILQTVFGWIQPVKSGWNQLLKSSWNLWVKSGWNTCRVCKPFLVGSNQWNHGETNCWNVVEIYGWNLVEIHVDFANYFWLDPMDEIGLNSIGEIRLLPLSSLFQSSVVACVS